MPVRAWLVTVLFTTTVAASCLCDPGDTLQMARCRPGDDLGCNESADAGVPAGFCSRGGFCSCNPGAAQTASGRCIDSRGLCPAQLPQTGTDCGTTQLVCPYGYESAECGGRTLRCTRGKWTQTEYLDPMASCMSTDGGCAGVGPNCYVGSAGSTCTTETRVPECVQGQQWLCPAGSTEEASCRCFETDAGCTGCPDRKPTCVTGVPRGLCGAVVTSGHVCEDGRWRCPEGSVSPLLCACSQGGLAAGCACSSKGWNCPSRDGGFGCTPGVPETCDATPGAGGGTRCTPGLSFPTRGFCTCAGGFELDPDIGRCRAIPSCGPTEVRADTPLATCSNPTGAPSATPGRFLCPVGQIPLRDYACETTATGCSCRVVPVEVPFAGPVTDGRCVTECSCTKRCPEGRTCTVFDVHWGDSRPTRQLGLCL